MKTSKFGPRTVDIAIVTAILAGCGGGMQSSIPPPNATQRSTALAPQSGYRVLYRFQDNAQGGLDGANPFARLFSTNDALYGTTYNGGAHGAGTVFSVTTGGAEKVLYAFRGGRDGANPEAGLIAVTGLLYGTTPAGGATCYPNGCGTVFSVTTAGTEKVLYRFRGGSDGADPFAGLINVNGILYGTTVTGGRGCDPSGCGTIFSVTTTGAEKVLHVFNGADGESPQAGLIDVNGVLYGATAGGGAHGKGTIFSVTTSGSETVLHSFAGGSDGWGPLSSLIDIRGTLYGTTVDGGSADCYNNYGYGTVFSLTTTGTEKVLHSFVGNSDGALPFASLIIVRGRLYGTTQQGGGGSTGCDSCGTVFALSP